MRLGFFRFFLMYLLSGLLLPGEAQQPLHFSQMEFDFGTVENWNNPPAVFPFSNESIHGQFLLSPRTHNSPFLIDLPRTRIESGESAEILVYYYTEKTGKFNETFQVFASGSPDPIVLRIKGNIKSFAEGALTECPDFATTKRVEQTDGPWKGIVIDAITKEPILNAKVDFPGTSSIFTNKRGGFELSLPFGFFQVVVSAQGYSTLRQMQGIRRNQPLIVFELYPLPLDSLNIPTPIIQDDSIPSNQGDFSIQRFKPNNIVLLYDISGSMKRDDRIGQLKSASKALIFLLRPVDFVSMLTFARVVTPRFKQVSGSNKAAMQQALDTLNASGTTEGGAGLQDAYQLARLQFIDGGNNQIILATDGRFDIDASLKAEIQKQRNLGIVLTVIGFGTPDSRGIETLKELAALGGGGFLLFQPESDNQNQLIELIRHRSKR